MATKNRRTSEDDPFDVFNGEEDIDDEELDEDGEDDEDFDYEKLTKSEKKRFDKIKSEVENSIIKAIASGDTSTEIHKGLQRVIGKKDAQISNLSRVLQEVVTKVDQQGRSGQDFEFIKEIVEEMLDENGKREFKNRFENFKSKKENEDLKNTVNQLARGNSPASYGAFNYGQEDEEPEEYKQYRREATQKLRTFAKKMGVDPDSDGLNYGDEREPLVARMDKLAMSVDKVKENQDDDDIRSARRKVTPSQTRTDSNPKPKKATPASANDYLTQASADILAKFRDGSLDSKRKR